MGAAFIAALDQFKETPSLEPSKSDQTFTTNGTTIVQPPDVPGGLGSPSLVDTTLPISTEPEHRFVLLSQPNSGLQVHVTKATFVRPESQEVVHEHLPEFGGFLTATKESYSDADPKLPRDWDAILDFLQKEEATESDLNEEMQNTAQPASANDTDNYEKVEEISYFSKEFFLNSGLAATAAVTVSAGIGYFLKKSVYPVQNKESIQEINAYNQLEEAIKEGTSDALINWWNDLESSNTLDFDFFSDPQNSSVLNLFLSSMVNIERGSCESILKSVFGGRLELEPKEFRSLINNLPITHKAKMALLAQYIEYKELDYTTFKNLLGWNGWLASGDWKELKNHLRYANLSYITASEVSKILSECPHLTQVIISHSDISKLPPLSKCEIFECVSCRSLKKLPNLSECRKFTLFDCGQVSSLPDLSKCEDFMCSNCNFTESIDLPSCKTFNFSNSTLSGQSQKTVNLPNCNTFSCRKIDLPEVEWHLPQCATFNCSSCELKLPSLPACEKFEYKGGNFFFDSLTLPKCTSFICNDCPLTEKLPNLPVCIEVECSKFPKLSQLPDLSSCIKFNCSECPLLIELPDLSNCIEVNCSGCLILVKIGDLSSCIKLNCSRCLLLALLPELLNCEELICSKCPLLPELPSLPRCVKLYCSECLILAKFQDLSSCKRLDCSDCPEIFELPPLTNCEELYCKNCIRLILLHNLSNCKTLYFNNCIQLRKIPELSQCRVLDLTDCSLDNLPENLPSTALVYPLDFNHIKIFDLTIETKNYEKAPLIILEQVGDFLLQENPNSKIYPFPRLYYTEDGVGQEAVDGGGLKRDCITQLCKNLFKKFDSFHPTEKTPILEDKKWGAYAYLFR